MSELVEGVCDTLAPLAADRGVDLPLFIDPGVPQHVWTDPTRLRQVLYNLVGNAIKFSGGRSHKRGRVAVRVEIATSAPLRLAIHVSDNGIGMSSQTVAEIFRPFMQAEASTTRRFGGTGLGLVICRHLMELMRGDVTVDSVLGEGSTFSVTLPVEAVSEKPADNLPDLTGLDCIVVGKPYLSANDMRTYLEHAGARVHLWAGVCEAPPVPTHMQSPVVVIQDAQEADLVLAEECAAAFGAEFDMRFLQITREKRHRLHMETTHRMSLAADGLRQESLLRAVLVAAGRAAPEVTFPGADDLWSGDAAAVPSVTEARTQGRLILVAEDDEVNQLVILQQLALLGYAAEVANNGEEALQLWRQGEHALLLTDLHMPELDGYALAQVIRKEEIQRGRTGRARMPILALTANALREEATRVRAVGMDQYLTKPILLSELGMALEAWLPHTAEAAPAQRADVIDTDVLGALVGHDPAVVRELLAEYLSSARRRAEELHAACVAHDYRRVGAIAHQLKSSSRSIGALSLCDLCAELENASRTGSSSEIERCMALTDVAMKQVEECIAATLAAKLEQLSELRQ